MKSLVYLKPLHAALKMGTEHAMQEFLEQHWRPLLVAYSHGSNGFLIVPQFRFGRDYRADFLVLSAHSGAWHAVMVELESPSAAPYLADGTESRTMRLAMRQVRDWDTWAELDPFRFREELVSELGRARTAVRGATQIARRSATTGLRDPDIYLARHFSIVIGRRGALTRDDRRRRSHTARQVPGLDIATYDRFIDIATMDSAREAEWRAYMRRQVL